MALGAASQDLLIEARDTYLDDPSDENKQRFIDAAELVKHTGAFIMKYGDIPLQDLFNHMIERGGEEARIIRQIAIDSLNGGEVLNNGNMPEGIFLFLKSFMPVRLSKVENNVFTALLQDSGRDISGKELIQKGWGKPVRPSNLSRIIQRINIHLKEAEQELDNAYSLWIYSDPSRGYQFSVAFNNGDKVDNET